MSASGTTHLREAAEAAIEEPLSARLEEAILQLRGVDRELRRAIAQVLSLQHALTLIENTIRDHHNGMKTAHFPPSRRPLIAAREKA